MATRRAVRSTRRDDQDELAEEPEDELAEEPEDELAEDPEDELEDPEDELAEEPEDELAEEPEDELEDPGEPAEEASEEADGRRHSRRPREGGLKAGKAGQAAMRQIAELTGKQAEGITGVEPGEDGWIVGVEVVEDRRIPSSTDILATYETEVDMHGDLVSYRRVKRYARGRGDSEDS